MISRWRSTLCGTIIHGPALPLNPQQVMGDSSQLLSCGGVKLNQKVQRSSRDEDSQVLHLPKSGHEIIMIQPNADMLRYGKQMRTLSDEPGVMDEALDYLDTKLHK